MVLVLTVRTAGLLGHEVLICFFFSLGLAGHAVCVYCRVSPGGFEAVRRGRLAENEGWGWDHVGIESSGETGVSGCI